MCRLFGFRSSVLSGVHASLIAAENALVNQSHEHPDGWGIAYYHSRFPHIIRSEKKALEDGLFKELSSVVSTHTLLAHIRQATTGDINVLNCHPFQHGPWSFAHNGQVSGYTAGGKIADAVAQSIDARFRGHTLGTTDSEACFYLFLSRLARRVGDIYHGGVPLDAVVESLNETIEVLIDLAPDLEDEPNRLNFIATNGKLMVANKYRRPLLFSTHKVKCPESELCAAYVPARCEAPVAKGPVNHLIISSETISEGPNVWVELDDGEWVGVDYGMNLKRGVLPALGRTPSLKLANF